MAFDLPDIEPLYRGDPAAGFANIFAGRDRLARGDETQAGGRWWNIQIDGRCLPRWDGQTDHKLDLVVRLDDALGDAVLAARWLPVARARVGRLTLIAPRPLQRLLRGQGYDVFDVNRDVLDMLTQVDAYATVDMLPHVLGDPVGAPCPYIRTADPPPSDRLRVGLVWAADGRRPYGLVRTIPLAALAPLGTIEGVALHALLSHNPRASDPRPAGMRMVEHAHEIRDVEDLRRLIADMDVLVTCDTLAANLAGAMNRLAVVLLPSPKVCWRWQREGDVTPWYPSCRLYRQQTAAAWSEPIARVAADLTQMQITRAA